MIAHEKDFLAAGDSQVGDLMAAHSTNGAQSVMRAIDVLDCLLEEGELSASEISNKLGLTMSTTHRLVKALDRRSLVVMDRVTKRYHLGPAVVRYSSALLQRSQDIIASVMPTMRQLQQLTGETVGLHWRVEHQRVCVAELVSAQPLRMQSGVGVAYPLLAGSAGKAILAFMTEAEQKEIFDGAAGNSAAKAKKLAQLKKSLAEVRDTGVAISRGETVAGAFGVAVPITNSFGTVVASLNITGPDVRLTNKLLDTITTALTSRLSAYSAPSQSKERDLARFS